MNFWQKLKKKRGKKPILCLAPMADVTDRAFRAIIAKYGKPNVMWTEFVSADGLFLGGKKALVNDLKFSKKEKPIVAQFFTSRPEMMEKAARLAVKLGFDGVDINMGCPDKSIEKQGAGAKLIQNPELAKEIILAAKRGVQNYKNHTTPNFPTGEPCGKERIPVSVKTRIGWNKNELETWLPKILEAEPAVVIIHARTRKELSLVPARWEHIRQAVEIRNKLQPARRLVRQRGGGGARTLIFGNGDVASVEDAIAKAKETGCDGVMIGRGIFGNPWLFGKKKKISTEDKLKVLIEHTKLFEKLVMPKPPKGQGKSFSVMKKHFKAYVNGFDGAKELRVRLMETKTSGEVEQIINNYLIT